MVALLADPKATAKRLDELRLLIEQSKKARAKLEADRAVHDRSVAAAEAEMIAKEQALRRREVDLAGREGVLRVVPSVGSAGSLSRAIHSLPPFGAALPDAGIGALPIVGERSYSRSAITPARGCGCGLVSAAGVPGAVGLLGAALVVVTSVMMPSLCVVSRRVEDRQRGTGREMETGPRFP